MLVIFVTFTGNAAFHNIITTMSQHPGESHELDGSISIPMTQASHADNQGEHNYVTSHGEPHLVRVH